ncbi:hypothetical protein SAMN05421505_12053 [Sinosporangium album]|uniref:Uncharacterized protein n=1 Tax=Sinosporangium album TaxID=504805 RepID=A0A1G8EDZ3_9ACTN|nr:hypothetical protein [Sinosporangium album]SDH67990.1 hypothetical protein SAMN05421505_12053 [Sinosporangium album]
MTSLITIFTHTDGDNDQLEVTRHGDQTIIRVLSEDGVRSAVCLDTLELADKLALVLLTRDDRTPSRPTSSSYGRLVPNGRSVELHTVCDCGKPGVRSAPAHIAAQIATHLARMAAHAASHPDPAHVDKLVQAMRDIHLAHDAPVRDEELATELLRRFNLTDKNTQ